MNFKTDGDYLPTEGVEDKDNLDLAEADAKQIILSAGLFSHQ